MGGYFDLPTKKEEIIRLTKKTEEPTFWDNHEEAEKTLNELNSIKELVAKIEGLQVEIEANLEITKLLTQEMEEDLLTEVEKSTEEITKKIEEGYPREFARQYCVESSLGCLGRKYKEDCDPEVFCCFKTVEEDKKWNYLDYDEQGNKIKK